MVVYCQRGRNGNAVTAAAASAVVGFVTLSAVVVAGSRRADGARGRVWLTDSLTGWLTGWLACRWRQGLAD